jgi:flagellar motor switch protein FliN/FliY
MSNIENEAKQQSTDANVNAAGKESLAGDKLNAQPLINPKDMSFLNDVQIVLTIEVGRTQIKIRDLLNLSKDSIIDLNKNAGEPVDIYANGKLISKGNIITANGKYCVRLTSIAQPVAEAT